MTVLAFDCAVSGLGVAVVRDGVRLAGLSEGGRDQAARLLPAIEAVLALLQTKGSNLTPTPGGVPTSGGR